MTGSVIFAKATSFGFDPVDASVEELDRLLMSNPLPEAWINRPTDHDAAA